MKGTTNERWGRRPVKFPYNFILVTLVTYPEPQNEDPMTVI